MQYPEEYYPIISDKFEVCFFVDLETSGLDAMRNEIITASLSVCDFKTLEQIDEIDLEFRPQNIKFWSEEAEKIHGIKLQKALSFPSKKESTKELWNFLTKYKKEGTQPMVSHSLNTRGYFFDQNFLSQHFSRNSDELYFNFRRICGISQSTINFAKAMGGFENYKLSTLAKHFGIELNHHDAKSDRKACQTLYKIFREA
jgi:DNA polymerase-3 subunit epsilon